MNAHKLAEELGTKAASSSKTKVGMPEPRADLNPPHWSWRRQTDAAASGDRRRAF